MRAVPIRSLLAVAVVTLAAAGVSACGSGDSGDSKDGAQEKDGGKRREARSREAKVLGSSTKKGAFPATLARATIENPGTIKVRVTPTPDAKVTVSWNVACRRARSAGNKSGRFTVRGPATRRLRAPLRRSEVCEASASAQMFRRGSIKVQVIG